MVWHLSWTGNAVFGSSLFYPGLRYIRRISSLSKVLRFRSRLCLFGE